MAKRIFIKECAGKAWNELHLFDDVKNTMTVYNQATGNLQFTFNFYTKPIAEWGYSSIDEAISKLSKRGILGNEVNADVQIESEIEGWANLIAYHIAKSGKKELSKKSITNCHQQLSSHHYQLSDMEIDWEIDFAISRNQVIA